MIKIPLSGQNGKGKAAIIDDDDYDKVSKIRWFCVRGFAERGEVI